MSGRSYYPTYFSIEDIMVTQEKVPCKTNVIFPRLGFLSADNEEEDLNKDVSLNVPIWLAKKLLQRRMNLIRVEVPNPFKEKARDVFEADATVVNLFRVNPNFYEFGLSFSRLKHRDSEIIRELLLKVFRKRFKMVFDWSIHRMTDPSKIQQLDLSEQRILKAGQKASELLGEWFIEAQFKMKPADMVVGLKKRKLLESRFDLQALCIRMQWLRERRRCGLPCFKKRYWEVLRSLYILMELTTEICMKLQNVRAQ